MFGLTSWVLWLHVMGAVIWIGGVLFVVTILRPVMQRALPPPDRRQLLKQVSGRMQRVVHVVIALQIITGTLLAWPYLRGGMAMFRGWWGQALLLKLLFVALMIALYLATPRLLVGAKPRLGNWLHFGLLGLGLVVIFIGTLL